MAFEDLMVQVRRLYAAKHYDEAVKKADLIPDAVTAAIKEEDRVFLGKVYLKAGVYDYASDILRKCKTTTREDVRLMKMVASKLKKSSNLGRHREASAIRTIFEDAVNDIGNGVHSEVAITKLDLLPGTEAHICYLQGLSKFNEGEPRDAKAILERCSGCLKPYYFKTDFDELVSQCSKSINKCLHDLLGDENINESCRQADVLDEGISEQSIVKLYEESFGKEEQEAEEGPPPGVEEQVEERPPHGVELLNRSFDLYSRCIIEDVKGDMFCGSLYLGDKVNHSSISLVDLGDADNAIREMNLMMSINNEFVLKGIGILQENSKYVVVQEVVSLRSWVDMKLKKFWAHSSSDCENVKNAWWKFIQEDLRALSRHACRGLKSLFDQNYGCNRLGNLDDDGIYISVAENKLKLLPSTNAHRLTEIENLKDLMYSIVGYPFQATAKDVVNDKNFGFCSEFRFFHKIISQDNISTICLDEV